MPNLQRLIEGVVDGRRNLPYEVTARILEKVGSPAATDLRYRWFMVPRPEYAWGVRNAAQLTAQLHLPGCTVIELGVATGNGLRAMEEHARRFASQYGVEIDVVGFDTGQGLPPPVDLRDRPYAWQEGAYAMDEERLRAKLRDAELVLGEVSETIPDFSPRHPIGFVSFDMDFYSSTMDGLGLFEGREWDRWLPRVPTYFDDLRTTQWEGELRAIEDWNESHDDRKIGQNPVLDQMVFGGPSWVGNCFLLHLFEHPSATTPLHPPKDIPFAAKL